MNEGLAIAICSRAFLIHYKRHINTAVTVAHVPTFEPLSGSNLPHAAPPLTFQSALTSGLLEAQPAVSPLSTSIHKMAAELNGVRAQILGKCIINILLNEIYRIADYQ